MLITLWAALSHWILLPPLPPLPFAHYEFLTAFRTCKIWSIFRSLYIPRLWPECSAHVSPQTDCFPGFQSLLKHRPCRLKRTLHDYLTLVLCIHCSLLGITFHYNSLFHFFIDLTFKIITHIYLFTYWFPPLKNLPAWLTTIYTFCLAHLLNKWMK